MYPLPCDLYHAPLQQENGFVVHNHKIIPLQTRRVAGAISWNCFLKEPASLAVADIGTREARALHPFVKGSFSLLDALPGRFKVKVIEQLQKRRQPQ